MGDLKNMKNPNTNVDIGGALFGNQEQYVTSGHNLVVFTSGEFTKYAPSQWVDKDVKTKNHLWIYKIDQRLQAKVIGHNYALGFRLKSTWRYLSKHDGEGQLVSREFQGIHKNKYWLIAFAYSDSGSIRQGDIVIFDVPSCALIWTLSRERFELSIGTRRSDKLVPCYSPPVYVCSYGIVLKREYNRSHYGLDNRSVHRRSEADFALHPVPFWDYEIMIKFLQPHVEYIGGIIDVILAYAVDPSSLNNAPISSNLRYIHSNAIVMSDGLDNFVVMASYWNKKQLKRIDGKMEPAVTPVLLRQVVFNLG